MTFERTTDYELVRRVVTHPRIWPGASDDFSPPAEEWRPIEHEALWYVAVRDGEEFLGLFVFVPASPVCWEVHTCLLPCSWGERAVQAAREVAEWIWLNSGCRRITTAVPAFNRLAHRLARRAGMREYGRNLKSYMKHGKLHDQILLGLSPAEKKCQ